MVQGLLQGATEETIREQLVVLSIQRDKAAAALQQNVYGHYQEFIQSTSDIGELENEVGVLRTRMQLFSASLSELSKSAGATLVETDATPQALEEARREKWKPISSLVDNLTAEFDSPERSFVRAFEVSELAPGTFEPLQMVCLIICTDAVIVATQRKLKSMKRRGLTSHKYAADRVMLLKDTGVINMIESDSA